MTTSKELKVIAENKLPEVCSELRSKIIEVMADLGNGHLGASLGAIELTVALHKVYNFPTDILIWDVGHQCYAHKLLTRDVKDFEKIRVRGGLSGFPKRYESEYDDFGTGHSSTSLSALSGFIESDLITGNNRKKVAVIGDGSFTAGMVFEALNNLGISTGSGLIILNDNGMSIDPNVGALHDLFQSNDEAQLTALFKAFNVGYLGTVSGHDLTNLIPKIKEASEAEGINILRVKTVKGYGYEASEKGDPTIWHAPGKFDMHSGHRTNLKKGITFQKKFGEVLEHLMQGNPSLSLVTPAMASGSALSSCLQKFPDRTFDVGIAEQHALTFSAGIAAAGTPVICSIYSTFFQRAFDQFVHDIVLQQLPVIVCLDRSGLVGQDGMTHQGIYDIPMLLALPNIRIGSPIDLSDLENMLQEALVSEQPVVIRYPKREGLNYNLSNCASHRVFRQGGKTLFLTFGDVGSDLMDIDGEFGHIDLRWIKPLNYKELVEEASNYSRVVIAEDGANINGIGAVIQSEFHKYGYRNEIISLGVPDQFIHHGTQTEQYEEVGLGKNWWKKFL